MHPLLLAFLIWAVVTPLAALAIAMLRAPKPRPARSERYPSGPPAGRRGGRP